MEMMRGEPIAAGCACGVLLRVARPLSFWGGVDPATGLIIDADSDAFGHMVAGTVLALAALRGSSSSSAVLLELIHKDLAPAALLLAEPDAILLAGVLVAREMGWRNVPVVRLAARNQARLPAGVRLCVEENGAITCAG